MVLKAAPILVSETEGGWEVDMVRLSWGSAPRRRGMKRAVLALVVAGVAGLAYGSAGATPTQKTEKIKLTYVSYGGALQVAEEAALIKPFEKLHPNIDVVYDPTTSYSKLKLQVESKNVTWDVVDVGNDFGLSPTDTKLLVKIDCKVVPCSVLQPKRYPTTGYRVNFSPSGEALGYNTKLMPAGLVPKTWADFFDTTKFPGKRTAMPPDAYSWAYEPALVASGVPRDKLYPLDLNRALSEWDKIKKDTTFTSNFQQCAESVATGDAVMGMCWSGRFYAMQKSGAPIAVSWDGATLNGGYLVIPKGSKHVKEAMQFIAFVVSKKAQAAFTNAIPYGPARLDALPLVRKDILPWLATKRSNQAIFINDAWWSKNREHAFQVWKEWLTK
jgi:putative spermidine/putrescine transport system substrate-binding protein